MRKTIMILAAATALSACVHTNPDLPARGTEPLNVPVVTKQSFVFDASSPDGSLSGTEQSRLNSWFSGLRLGYGDRIYVEGPYADGARRDVAQVAGRYGLLLSDGAPMMTGEVAPGTVRVIVNRTRASVPNCPNWSRPSEQTLDNVQMSGLGCSVNSNLAAMVANSEDLVHGQEGGLTDNYTSSRAIDNYRKGTPAGGQSLSSMTSKGDK